MIATILALALSAAYDIPASMEQVDPVMLYSMRHYYTIDDTLYDYQIASTSVDSEGNFHSVSLAPSSTAECWSIEDGVFVSFGESGFYKMGGFEPTVMKLAVKDMDYSVTVQNGCDTVRELLESEECTVVETDSFTCTYYTGEVDCSLPLSPTFITPSTYSLVYTEFGNVTAVSLRFVDVAGNSERYSWNIEMRPPAETRIVPANCIYNTISLPEIYQAFTGG